MRTKEDVPKRMEGGGIGIKSVAKKIIKFICFTIFTLATALPSVAYVTLLLHPEMANVINMMVAFWGDAFLFRYVVPNLIYFVSWAIVVYKIIKGRCKWWYHGILMGVGIWNWWTLIRLGALLGVLDEMFVGLSQSFTLSISPIADSYYFLNETQRVTIMGVLISVILLYLLYSVVGKRHKHIPDISTKTGTKLRGGRQVDRGGMSRKMEYYTSPGTYDIVERRPHKYEPRRKPEKKSWDKELDDWVKKRRNK